MRRQTEAIMADLGVHISGDRLVKDLTIASQQMVEIAKAVSRNAYLLLMDEPTSALSSKEVDALFNLMQRLKQKGVSVVFVSHRLEEVLRVVDRIIVMRDGRRVGTLSAAEASEAKLIQLMVGRGRPVPKGRRAHWRTGSGTARPLRQNGVRNVSFKVHKGEIVGAGRMIGAGAQSWSA